MPNLYDQSQQYTTGVQPPQAPAPPTHGIFNALPGATQPYSGFEWGRPPWMSAAPQQPQQQQPAPSPWGVAPQLPTRAPPQLPYPGQSSSMRGAPLTPNNTGMPYPAIPPSTDFGDPMQAQWEAGMNLLDARGIQLSAQRAYEGMKPMAWTAKGNVLDARQKALGAQSLYLSEQGRNNATRLSEEQAIQTARNNPTDVLAVARAQRERDNTDYRYRLAGLSTPIEITRPDGFQGPLPPGIRDRLESIADKLTRQSTDKEKVRKYNEEAARIASASAGQEVTAADIAQGRIALTLEQAERAVKYAGYDVDQAQLAEAATKMPPAPGLSWDAEGGQWVNTGELADIKRLRENAGNEWAGFSVSELMSLLNGDKLDPNTFRAILTDPNGKYGFLPTTVDHLIDLAAVMKTKTTPIDPSLLVPKDVPPPSSGSGTGGQQQGTGPSTSGGSPLPKDIGTSFGNRFRPR